MKLTEFTHWLNQVLDPNKFKDYCTDGLNVEASDTVTHIVTGVSFRESLVDKAIEKGADAIIVHHPHGLWNNEPRMPVGPLARKLRKLLTHGISLYAFHLPLDGQPEFGNNAEIARILGLQVQRGFMQEGQATIGCIGTYEKSLTKQNFLDKVNAVFPHGIENAFMNGSDQIQNVALCSGGGTSGIREALALGVDTFFTGEIHESTPIFSEEEGFNLVACGHHRTEIFGVRALAAKIQKELNIPAEFIDIDNPI